MLAAALTVPEESLPDFLAELERVRVVAWIRLMRPAPTEHLHDELLSIGEAARRLNVSRDYVYHHHSDFSFTRRVGRNLRFSANGIDAYIRRRR